MQNPLHRLLALVPLALLACDPAGEGEPANHRFLGTWKSNRVLEYTHERQLFRDSLNRYMLERGVDLPQYFENPSEYEGPPYDTVMKHMAAFTYECPATEPCSRVLWREETFRRFGPDTLSVRTYRGDSLKEAWDMRYWVREDSLLLERWITPVFFDTFSVGFAFNPGGDTLFISASGLFPGENDTLIRVE